MNYITLKRTVDNCKPGTIHTMTYTKELKTKKDIKDVITKTSIVQVKFHVDYSNISRVKDWRAAHEVTEKTGHMSGVNWLDSNRNFLRSKTGHIQLRATKAHGNKTKTEYFKNGVKVEKEDIVDLCLKSEFPIYKENGAPVEVFNIGIDKIISIK